jgi:hypothetical protein
VIDEGELVGPPRGRFDHPARLPRIERRRLLGEDGLPASSAASAMEACSEGGVTIVTRSISGARARTRQSSKAGTPRSSATRRVLSGSLPAIPPISSPANRKAGACVRAPQPVPMIPILAIGFLRS